MIRNFFTVAFRNILRQKSYFFINTTGLAIGIASSIIILLFVINELSYDQFNEKHKQIFRLYLDGRIGEAEIKGAWTAAPTAKAIKNGIQEVIDEVRTDNWYETIVKINDKSFIENNFLLADTNFFKIFSFRLIKGDPDTVLAAPHSLVLTENAAKKFFGDEDPIGKKVLINVDTNYYTVTGVMENVPENSHFDFTILGSFSTHWRANSGDWLTNSFSTYLLLKEGVSHVEIEKKLKPLVEKYIGPQVTASLGITIEEWFLSGNRYQLFLQPLDDIHLNPAIQHNAKPSNNERYIYIFSIVAILIIIVAVINYMNLSTAKSVKRAKEVGLRKVSGSLKEMLVFQFLLESILLSFISLLFALILVQLFLPFVNAFTKLNLTLDFFSNWYNIPALILLAIIVGILSGSYPSFFLSSFSPIVNISGLSQGNRKSFLRSALVIFQFCFSIIVIFGTIVIYRQINFMLNKELGFDKKNLMIIKAAESLGDFSKIDSFENEILKLPEVLSTSNSTGVPNHLNVSRAFLIDRKDTSVQAVLLHLNWIDNDFLNTYRIKLKEGRPLSYGFYDSLSIIINESAVKKLQLSNPLSVRFIQPDTFPDRSILNVVGVVEDFHFQSLHEDINPYAFLLKPAWWNWGGYISVRISPENMKQTISNIENTWKKYTPSDPFQYYFMEDEFNTIYQEEIRTGNIVMGFAVLAIAIACLGLFGLTSYASEQRTKEIGIRKALGSSIYGIIVLLTRQIFYLILISTFIAWPIAYLLMKKWLLNFQYHVEITFSEFIVSFLIALVIAMLTVFYKAYMAAASNPVVALKYE